MTRKHQRRLLCQSLSLQAYLLVYEVCLSQRRQSEGTPLCFWAAEGAGRPLGTQHGQSSRLNSEPPGLSLFLPQDLKKYGATTVVRVCEVTYDKTPLEKDGITVVVRDM